MLPTVHVSDPGENANATIYGGPFVGPDTFQENGLTFYDFDRDCLLQDATAALVGGGALTQAHAYLLAIGDVNNVKAVLLGQDISPAVNQRSVPGIQFKKGDRLYVRGAQLSTGGAAEATVLTLRFAPRAAGL